MTAFEAVMLPLAVLLIGLGVLVGAAPLGNPPRFNLGWLLILIGTILAGVSVILDLTQAH